MSDEFIDVAGPSVGNKRRYDDILEEDTDRSKFLKSISNRSSSKTSDVVHHAKKRKLNDNSEAVVTNNVNEVVSKSKSEVKIEKKVVKKERKPSKKGQIKIKRRNRRQKRPIKEEELENFEFDDKAAEYLNKIDGRLKMLNQAYDTINDQQSNFVKAGEKYISFKLHNSNKKRKGNEENMKHLWNTYSSVTSICKQVEDTGKKLKTELKNCKRDYKILKEGLEELINLNNIKTRNLRIHLQGFIKSDVNYNTSSRLLPNTIQ